MTYIAAGIVCFVLGLAFVVWSHFEGRQFGFNLPPLTGRGLLWVIGGLTALSALVVFALLLFVED